MEEIKNEIENSGSDQAKLINTIIYPRYHFSPSYNNVDSYYERSPFTYSPIYSHSCRFVLILFLFNFKINLILFYLLLFSFRILNFK